MIVKEKNVLSDVSPPRPSLDKTNSQKEKTL